MRVSLLCCSLLAFALGAAGCEDEPAGSASGSKGRFEGVKAPSRAAKAAEGFCDHTFPKQGEGSKRFTAAPTRPAPAGKGDVEVASDRKGWTWVNVWATWCEPCKEEMGLLGRWHGASGGEGFPFTLQLLSIDVPDAEEALKAAAAKGLPGKIAWIRSEADFPPFLEALGVDKNAAIPIHALVDPEGMLRCVRVGAIHDRDYGTVKAILSGS